MSTSKGSSFSSPLGALAPSAPDKHNVPPMKSSAQSHGNRTPAGSKASSASSSRYMHRKKSSRDPIETLDTRTEAEKLRDEIERELRVIMSKHSDVLRPGTSSMKFEGHGSDMHRLSVVLEKSYAETAQKTKNKTPRQQNSVLQKAVREEIEQVQATLDR
jgi:hypothetical protein